MERQGRDGGKKLQKRYSAALITVNDAPGGR